MLSPAAPADSSTTVRLVSAFLEQCRADAALLAAASAADLALEELAVEHERRMATGRPEATEIAIVRMRLTRCRDMLNLAQRRLASAEAHIAHLTRK